MCIIDRSKNIFFILLLLDNRSVGVFFVLFLSQKEEKVNIFSRFAYNLGPVNAILSWKIWTPLAKLSYTAYLIHPSIIFFYHDNRKVHLHYDDITMVSNSRHHYFDMVHFCMVLSGICWCFT